MAGLVPTYSRTNPNGRAQSDEPRRRPGPEPKCGDPAWVAAVIRLRTLGCTIDEIAAGVDCSAESIKVALARGRGSGEEPYATFARRGKRAPGDRD